MDFNIGDVVARIRLDLTPLQQGMAQAQQALGQFQQRVQSTAAQSNAQLTTSLNPVFCSVVL
jgi:hypothetical protein